DLQVLSRPRQPGHWGSADRRLRRRGRFAIVPAPDQERCFSSLHERRRLQGVQADRVLACGHPEPATRVLMLIGVGATGAVLRRRALRSAAAA
ncbi:MAG: PEP-CTERM sorting domain-containing protein, partial [Caulobacteraceae bacterium]|nr:PEP-CTERM sorting domain-containing protein [Caulobacteraceae bacterium]